ncbi:hypothetical protein Tco_1564824, partial [Tanacetum coccineum]
MTLTKKIFGNMKRGFTKVPRPLLPAMLPSAESAGQEAQPSSSATTQPPPTTQLPPTTQPPPTPTPSTSHPTPPTPVAATHTTPPSAEPKTEPEHAHMELKDTKQTYETAIVTLVKKVKSLEVELKRKTRKIIIFDSEGEETEAYGRNVEELDDDPLISLEKGLMTPTKSIGNASVEPKSVDKGKRYKRRKEFKAKSVDAGLNFEEDINSGFEDVNSAFKEVNTGNTAINSGNGPVNTDSARVSIPSPPRTQREGKAPIIIEETQASTRTKEQILQEEASLAEA